jgi:ParB family chromosome partitioning protein
MNPRQPRTEFAERELSELAESVRAVGILQPLVVRRAGEGYELIAGERRLRAAKMAGLGSVPVVERAASDDELLTLALVENLQREDLNAQRVSGMRQHSGLELIGIWYRTVEFHLNTVETTQTIRSLLD